MKLRYFSEKFTGIAATGTEQQKMGLSGFEPETSAV
jgi:hypothetical protein